MPLYPNTAPTQGDSAEDSRAKAAQILTSGAVGAASPLYTTTDPADGDDLSDSLRKTNQYLHVHNGL